MYMCSLCVIRCCLSGAICLRLTSPYKDVGGLSRGGGLLCSAEMRKPWVTEATDPMLGHMWVWLS